MGEKPATVANALHYRPFVFYWLATWAIGFAVQIMSVSVAWQIYDITRDPLALGFVGLAQFAPPLVLVTHHVDEVPPGMTHVLMLRQGAVLAHGPIDSTLTAPLLSECFDLDLRLERRADGRWTAFAAG